MPLGYATTRELHCAPCINSIHMSLHVCYHVHVYWHCWYWALKREPDPRYTNTPSSRPAPPILGARPLCSVRCWACSAPWCNALHMRPLCASGTHSRPSPVQVLLMVPSFAYLAVRPHGARRTPSPRMAPALLLLVRLLLRASRGGCGACLTGGPLHTMRSKDLHCDVTAEALCSSAPPTCLHGEVAQFNPLLQHAQRVQTRDSAKGLCAALHSLSGR